jgi:hypothetical protein
MKTLGILLVSALLFAGCKKKEETPAAGSASGSSAMGSSAGSDTGTMGSAAGSGSDTMAGSGSGSAMAGSGSAMGSAAGSGSDTMAAGGGGIKDEADYEAKRTAGIDEGMAMWEGDKDDCKKLGTDMVGWAEKNKQLIKDLKAYEKDHPDVKKKVDAKLKAKEKEQQTKMKPIMTKCMKDKDFMASMKKMGEMMK